jgi:alpha-mannosidase
MNTEGAGTPIIVYNPLNIDRQDVVEANISFPDGAPAGVRVTGPDGQEVLSQLDGQENGATKVLFLAKVPSVGFAVFNVQPTDQAAPANAGLQAT